MNSFTGQGALQRAQEFLEEKADQVAAEHVPPLYFDLIGNALSCDREYEYEIKISSIHRFNVSIFRNCD